MTVTYTRLKISDEEYQARCERLREHLVEQNLKGVVLFDSFYALYYSGFAFMPTERPMAFVMNQDGEKGLFVPRLELEHARSLATIDRVDDYPEYPGETHPMELLTQTLKEMGIEGKVGVDSDGYPPIVGYRGPALSQQCACEVTFVREFVEAQMMVKSPAEIELLKESARWANLAHRLLQEYTRVGVTETEVSRRASNEATFAMLSALGPLYRAQSANYTGAVAGYRGQIGRTAAIPHSLANNIKFEWGDILVTGATAPMWGYVSELERTMFIGEPDDDKTHFFNHMKSLQEVAFEAIKPGIPCSDVDKEVRAYYDKFGLWPYWRHHVGHAIGLRYHEGPFLDIGDETIIQPGMVFTVEPGLYVNNLGGFRHSDTVVVTEDGIEIITFYPRNIEGLTLPA